MNTGTPRNEEIRPSEPKVNSNPSVRQPSWRAYVLAVLSTSATMISLLGLDAWALDQPTLILFVIPIILSAYVGGAGPGLLSTFLAGVSIYFLSGPGGHSLLFNFIQFRAVADLDHRRSAHQFAQRGAASIPSSRRTEREFT